ncbi:carboxymuconolactone decarboxylase family protein [Nocardia transvalensis]|uniref:carboxymuconolactone decarboxylase family protein n=1 Tax=Nocardia transvalensis TaxID=37333 RepID=UPI001892F356|nr:carboxymuconolactone decarboxylase family protein [Nocardia transvalensis]MBF6330272.1 carboxymuconolactone decarboxylase family protein [Nocardia transvalensis]
MARIDLLDPSEMATDKRRVYEAFPSNLIRGLLTTNPEIAEGYLRLSMSFARSSLDPALRELAILRVGTLTGCDYAWLQHVGRARDAGASEQQISAAKTGNYATLDKLSSAALGYVDECVANFRVPQKTFDVARTALGDENLVTLTLLVGHYMATTRFIENFDIDLDDKPSVLGSASNS